MIQYSEELDSYIANTKECAKLFGVSLSAFQKWKIKPIGKVKTEVYYDVPQLISEKLNEAKSNQSSGLSEERRKYIKARRQKAELELLEIQKSLISIELVKKEWTDSLENFKSSLISMPMRLAGVLSKIDNPQEIEHTIRKEIQNAFEEIRGDKKQSRRRGATPSPPKKRAPKRGKPT